MRVKAGDKIEDWKALANADSEIRKKARFAMRDRATDAMDEQD